MGKTYTVNKSLYLSIDVEADSVSDAIDKAGEYSLDDYEPLKSETLVFLGNDMVTEDDDE